MTRSARADGVLVLRQPQFNNDVRAAYAAIASDSPRAARHLLYQMQRAILVIADFPKSGRAREDLFPDIRSVQVPRFRHLIFYRVETNAIVLLRLVHGARDLGALKFD